MQFWEPVLCNVCWTGSSLYWELAFFFFFFSSQSQFIPFIFVLCTSIYPQFIFASLLHRRHIALKCSQIKSLHFIQGIQEKNKSSRPRKHHYLSRILAPALNFIRFLCPFFAGFKMCSQGIQFSLQALVAPQLRLYQSGTKLPLVIVSWTACTKQTWRCGSDGCCFCQHFEFLTRSLSCTLCAWVYSGCSLVAQGGTGSCALRSRRYLQ